MWFFEELLQNPAYMAYALIALCVVAVLIAAVILTVVNCRKRSRLKKAAKAAEKASVAEKNTSEAEAVVAEASVEDPTPVEPAPKKEEPKPTEEPKQEETPKAEEPKLEEAPKTDEPKTEEPVAVQETPKTEKPKKASRVLGKYDFTLGPDGYHYSLLANNGQLLYSSVGYTTLDGARAGVDTFKRAVSGDRFHIRYDRGGKYSFVLDGKFYGEGYQGRSQCERAIESVKRFAMTENFAEPAFSEESMAEFRAARAGLKNQNSVAWERVAEEEANAQKLGKFMIDPEEVGASFTLIANNGQCLYTSRVYSDVKSATAAVDAFKKAVYIGNFFVTNDKFGNFRFVLKGAGTNWYVGDSYAARERCASAIESVKNFVKTAELVVNKTTLTEESAEEE